MGNRQVDIKRIDRGLAALEKKAAKLRKRAESRARGAQGIPFQLFVSIQERSVAEGMLMALVDARSVILGAIAAEAGVKPARARKRKA